MSLTTNTRLPLARLAKHSALDGLICVKLTSAGLNKISNCRSNRPPVQKGRITMTLIQHLLKGK